MKKNSLHVIRTFLAGIVLFLLLDALIFRTPLYLRWVSPNSYAGLFELAVLGVNSHPPAKGCDILLLGDSRLAEGFSTRIANQLGDANRLRFISAAMGGSTPRVWFYLLQEIDPAARRFNVILIPVDDYNDTDWVDWANYWIIDLHFINNHLRLTDAPELIWSFDKLEARLAVCQAMLLHGFVMKKDVQDFLENPKQRLAEVKYFRNVSINMLNPYQGNPRTLTGLTFDRQTKKITYPLGLSAGTQKFIQEYLLRDPVPQMGATRQYRQKWFGKIVERYRNNSTRIYFYRLPRRPIVIDNPPTSPHCAIREFAAKEQVKMLDEHLFEFLECPKYFFDAYHLNAEGRKLFTTKLVEEIQNQLFPDLAGAGGRGHLDDAQ